MAQFIFTDREYKILSLLNQGFNNKTIAYEAGISVNTVKYHLKNIFRKLSACNRLEAIQNFNALET
ncbi:MAG: response regulator transcription factor [Bacteroidales bacterium]